MPTRQFIRDWRGRFAVTGIRRVKRVKRPHVRRPTRPRLGGTHKLSATAPAKTHPEMAGKRLEPPSWDRIKGTNAKRDGKLLWERKKAGEFASNVELFKAADQYHRIYRKNHPNDTNYASKNQIANASYRHELEERGELHYMPWPGEKAEDLVYKPADTPAKKAPAKAPAKAPPKKDVIDKTKGGVSLVGKSKAKPKPKPESEEDEDDEDSDAELHQDPEFLKGTYGKEPAKPKDVTEPVTFEEVKRGDVLRAESGRTYFKVTGRQKDLIVVETVGGTGKALTKYKDGFDKVKWVRVLEKGKKAEPTNVIEKAKAKLKAPPVRASELRHELRTITDNLEIELNKFDFTNMTEADKVRYRELTNTHTKRLLEIEKQLETLEPDLSREIVDAKDYKELREIMENRHPTLVVDDFGTKVNVAIDKGRAKFPGDRRVQEALYNRDHSFAATRSSFRALDAQMTKYPKVKIWRFMAELHGTHDEEVTGAACSRGTLIQISINPAHLADVRRVLNRARDNQRTNWHAQGHEKAYYYNNIVHEFGHAVDWRANIIPVDFDSSKSNSKQAVEDATAKRRKDISKIITDVYFEEVKPKGKVDAQDVLTWLREDKQVTGYSWDREDPTILQDDELLAEAWTDVRINNLNATLVNRALHAYMIEGLRKNKAL